MIEERITGGDAEGKGVRDGEPELGSGGVVAVADVVADKVDKPVRAEDRVEETDATAEAEGDFESELEELAEDDEVIDLLRYGVLLICAVILDERDDKAMLDTDGDELGKVVRVAQ